MLDEYRNDSLHIVSAWLDKQLVGWAVYFPSYQKENTCDMSIIVDPKFHRLGVATGICHQIRLAVGSSTKICAYPFDKKGKQFFESLRDSNLEVHYQCAPKLTPIKKRVI
jgi:hypothetical protein